MEGKVIDQLYSIDQEARARIELKNNGLEEESNPNLVLEGRRKLLVYGRRNKEMSKGCQGFKRGVEESIC